MAEMRAKTRSHVAEECHVVDSPSLLLPRPYIHALFISSHLSIQKVISLRLDREPTHQGTSRIGEHPCPTHTSHPSPSLFPSASYRSPDHSYPIHPSPSCHRPNTSSLLPRLRIRTRLAPRPSLRPASSPCSARRHTRLSRTRRIFVPPLLAHLTVYRPPSTRSHAPVLCI